MGVWADTIGSISGGSSTIIWQVLAIVGGVGLSLILLGVAAWYWFVKKKWNIKAEIKLPRSDGKLTNSEWGKAYFNAKRGVCVVKRPGMGQPKIAIPIFDIRKYVQGDNTVTFIYLGPDDVKPVLNESWENFEDTEPMTRNGKIVVDKHGKPMHERAALMTIRVDSGKDKAWKTAWAEAARQAYSLKSFFTQFQTPIAIAIVIIAVFVGFAMVWTRLGSVCGG